MSIITTDIITALAMPEPKHVVLEGNQATVYTGEDIPAIEPTKIMQISKRQASLYLLSVNLYDTIESFIASKSREAQINWETATDIARDYPLLLEVQTALGWTEEELDSMFLAASQVV